MAESSRSTRKKVAEDLLAARRAEAAGGQSESASARKASFDDLARLLLADMQANGRRTTSNVEKYRLPYLRSAFDRVRVTDIGYSVVQCYIARRLETAAPATVLIEIKLLRRMFKLAARAKLLNFVPELPTVAVGDNARTGFCSAAEIERVIGHLPPHAKPIVRCLFLSGWRSSEILQLRWSRVDLDAETMRLDASDTKSRRPRIFPYGRLPELRTILHEQREATTTLERERGAIIPWVFHRGGEPIASIRTAWRRAVKAAGLPALLPHDLRRAAARNMIRAGVREDVVMKLCGWSTRAMLSRYLVVDVSDLSDGVGRLSEFLASASVHGEAER